MIISTDKIPSQFSLPQAEQSQLLSWPLVIFMALHWAISRSSLSFLELICIGLKESWAERKEAEKHHQHSVSKTSKNVLVIKFFFCWFKKSVTFCTGLILCIFPGLYIMNQLWEVPAATFEIWANITYNSKNHELEHNTSSTYKA